MIRLIALLVFLGLSLGCHSTTVVYKSGDTPYSASKDSPSPDKKARQGSWVFGIYQFSGPEEAACTNTVPEVRMVTGFTDLIIHFFIGPFYTTKTVEVYCRK